MGYMGYFTLRIKTVSWYISFNNFPYYLVIWGFQDGSQKFKLVLEKAEEPEIKWPTSAGSWEKEESSRKTSIY